jgi:hypothetical protein
MFVSAVFFDVYTRVTADYLSYSSFVSLVYSGGFIQEAASSNTAMRSFSGALTGLLPLLFGIGLETASCACRCRMRCCVAAPLLWCAVA